MKRFKFSLEKVLDYRRHIQDKEKDALARLRAELNQLLDEERELHLRYEAAKREYAENSAAGIKIIDAAVMLNNIEDIRRLIEIQKAKIIDKELQVDNQAKKLIVATQDKMTVEKLREKKLEIYRGEETKSEEKFIDDFLSNRKSLAV